MEHSGAQEIKLGDRARGRTRCCYGRTCLKPDLSRENTGIGMVVGCTRCAASKGGGRGWRGNARSRHSDALESRDSPSSLSLSLLSRRLSPRVVILASSLCPTILFRRRDTDKSFTGIDNVALYECRREGDPSTFGER